MVKITKPTTLAFIFSEHWPSGSFVAKSLGVTKVYTYVHRASLGFQEPLRHGGLGETLSSLEAMSQGILTRRRSERNVGYMARKFCGLCTPADQGPGPSGRVLCNQQHRQQNETAQ